MPEVGATGVTLSQMDIQKKALILWTNLATLSIKFENLLNQAILKTDIKQWLINYRSNLNDPNIVYTLQLCNILMYSESIHDYIPHPELQLFNHKTVSLKENQTQRFSTGPHGLDRILDRVSYYIHYTFF